MLLLGWTHYMVHNPEPQIVLLRRPRKRESRTTDADAKKITPAPHLSVEHKKSSCKLHHQIKHSSSLVRFSLNFALLGCSKSK